jgi:hypothetical protein
MTVTTALSRHTRHLAKTMTREQLLIELERANKQAIAWTVIPGGSQRANKWWDAVSFYQKLLNQV